MRRDGVQDDVDNCGSVWNPDQLDTDRDGQGDACDSDKDNDGVRNEMDNCALVPNRDQRRSGVGQLRGDACWNDKDGDGVPDSKDVCTDRNDVSRVDFRSV